MPLSLIFPINLPYIIFIAIVFVWSCPHLQLFCVFWYGFNIDSSLKIALDNAIFSRSQDSKESPADFHLKMPRNFQASLQLIIDAPSLCQQ